MWQIARQAHRDKVAGLQGGDICWQSAFGAAMGQEGFQIGNAAMIDIAVRAGKSPQGWISGEPSPHIFMDTALEVDLQRVAIGPDDDISAHTAQARNIAIWISNRLIGAIIYFGDADLGAGGPDKLYLRRLGIGQGGWTNGKSAKAEQECASVGRDRHADTAKPV